MLNFFRCESPSNLWAYSFDINPAGIIALKFTPSIKEFSGFRKFSMGFVNLLSL